MVKDNGWKMQYRRVIDVEITNAYAKAEESANDVSVLPFILGGAAVILVIGAVVVIVLVRKKKSKKKQKI